MDGIGLEFKQWYTKLCQLAATAELIWSYLDLLYFFVVLFSFAFHVL